MFLKEYSDLTKNCTISKLDEIFSFYYADTNKIQVLARECIELDIRSAFPTICRIMFGEESAFVKNIFKIDNKLERNIFISTTLNHDQLKTLNSYCKLLIFGKVYNNFDDVHILEYKKDGIVFTGKEKDVPVYDSVENYLTEQQIEFRNSKIKTYLRFNKTSVYDYDDNGGIEIKGKYKDCPKFLQETIIPEVFKDKFSIKLNSLRRVYTTEYFETLKQNHLTNQLKDYYMFGDKIISPQEILTNFLYPLLELLRSNEK